MTVNFSTIAKTVHTINNGNRPYGALIVEIPTDIGRSYAGYKRGGFLEGAEKFRKEVMAAVVWLVGIPVFKSLGDKFCENILKIPMAIDFSNSENGNSAIEDTVEFLVKETKEKADEFINNKEKAGNFFDTSALPEKYFREGKSIFAGMDAQKLIKNVKSAKVITSIAAFALNIALLGVGLPLLNQAMTRKKMANMKNDNQQATTLKVDNFEDFRAKTKKESNKISFTGLQNVLKHPLLSFVDGIENSNTFRLIAPDAPMMAGRIKTSRNKYEALETIVIDGAGIFLYNFCADCVQNFLRKKTQTPSIAPTLSEIISSKDENVIKNAIKKIEENKDVIPKLADIFDKDTAQEIYKTATYGKYGKINKYVKFETLKGIDEEVCKFLKKLKDEKPNLTKEDIASYIKKTNNKNALFLGIGLLTAILGQAVIVPKVAFKITEKLTGKNQFTGIANYENEKK